MPGIPRANYLPFPFQIVQTPEYILVAYEFASASRVLYMARPDFESPFDTWMGHSRGHWEGETLVVDVTSQVPDTWFVTSKRKGSVFFVPAQDVAATSTASTSRRTVPSNAASSRSW